LILGRGSVKSFLQKVKLVESSDATKYLESVF
jgi:hypothetical protein